MSRLKKIKDGARKGLKGACAAICLATTMYLPPHLVDTVAGVIVTGKYYGPGAMFRTKEASEIARGIQDDLYSNIPWTRCNV